ncbi:MAG: PTS mannitol transporter subunit IICBA [Clostridiaceae bacterium]|nr:PTS mannitol transporter subunit IICBA [Clostridiaceae bacterium]
MEVNKTELNTKLLAQDKVQKFGRFLSGMVMPNIGAFIAWGLITAIFIPAGWMPNAKIATLVHPIVHYVLPLLIGYTGGKSVGGVRGGVLGTIATIGIIVGYPDIHMFMGAMIMGPLGGYLIKKFDELVEGKIPAGFEMLVNNFSAGIIGAGIAITGLLGIGPIIAAITAVLKGGLQAIMNAGLLPLVSLVIEPAKILFLNNTINHGILGPLGLSQAVEAGKSVMFLLETNPGPGLGILLAYWAFAKGAGKESAPGAIIIHFLGGIHEIYFPYVLMNPILILAVIAGGVSGVFTFTILGAGLVAAPGVGSILALMAMSPKGGLIPVLTGVLVATAVSFIVAAFFIKKSNDKSDVTKLVDAIEKAKELKGKVNAFDWNVDLQGNTSRRNIKKVIFACDAGVGSSAMGATTLRNKLRKNGINIEVTNCPVDDLPYNAEVVITHESLAGRAKACAPKADYISVRDFINNDAFEKLLEILGLTAGLEVEEEDTNSVLRKKNIKLNLKAADKYEAIRTAGRLLVDGGYVEEGYIEAMIDRENDLSTYVGQGVAIPHGVGAAKEKIINSGMIVLQYPEGVLFGEELAYIVVGIAGVGDKHLGILGNIAMAIGEANEEVLNKLRHTEDIKFIYELFTKN